MAQYRKMRRNESTAIPTQLVCVAVDWVDALKDPEGAVIRRQFSRAAAVGCRIREGKATAQTVATFSNPDHFWDWLDQETDRRRLTWVVGCGAGSILQLLGLGPVLDRGIWQIDTPGGKYTEAKVTIGEDGLIGGLFVVGDPPVIVGLRGPKGGRVLFLSTENYTDGDLDALSAECKLERIAFGPDNGGGIGQANRLRRDAEIVQRWFMQLIEWWIENDFGMLRWTASGLAMAAYRHRFMREAPTLHDDTDAKRLERAAYRGGECCVFKIGEINHRVHQVDVVSLFPHVMRTMHYPSKLVNYVRLNDWRHGPPPGNPEECIAEVAIDSEHEPILVAGDDSVIRCNGKIITALCGPELAEAVKRGLVVGWRSVAVYKLSPLFRDYVDGIWPLRQKYLANGDTGKSKLTKRLLNCLYGKFGQYSKRLIYRPDMISPRPWAPFWSRDIETQSNRYFFSIGYKVFEERTDDNYAYSSAAISGFITSYARLYMQRMRDIAGNQQVYYQAIDSLVVSDLGLERLRAYDMVDPLTIGKFKIEHSAESVNIVGVHDYRIGSKVVTGWKANIAVKIADTKWAQIQSERLGQAMRHMPHHGLSMVCAVRERAPTYKLGEIGPDGWTKCLKVCHYRGLLPSSGESLFANDCATSSIRNSIGSSAAGGAPSTAKTTA